MSGHVRKLWVLDGPKITLDSRMVMVGASGTITFASPCFLIEHARGLVLFDTGFAPEALRDPVAVYGESMDHLDLDYTEEHLLENQLDLAGFSRTDVTHVILSHAHIDHTGGLPLFKHAQLYAGEGELRYALWPDEPQDSFFHRSDIEAMRGCRWNEVRDDHDLFGDGAIVLLTLPGHTPGSLGLLVRLATQTIIITGDAVHLNSALESGFPSGTDANTQQSMQSIRRLRMLRDSLDATVWVPHEPSLSEWCKTAPFAYE